MGEDLDRVKAPDETAIWVAHVEADGEEVMEFEFPCYAIPWELPRPNQPYAVKAVATAAREWIPIQWGNGFEIKKITHKKTGRSLI